MKKIVIGLFLVAFALTATAQDKMTKKSDVKTVSFEQTAGEFTQKSLTLSEGTYVFTVSNNNAAPEVGLVLIEEGKDGANPKNTYKYFCPFNKTPQYALIVK